MSTNVQDNMKTFKNLYTFLQTFKDSSILPFLKENWIGKEKQESLFRLFSLLKLFPQFKNYCLCAGNFNNKTIHEVKSVSLYLNNKLKDSGDYSDLTLRSDKVVIATTSKNYGKYGVGDLDISKIKHVFEKYNGLSLLYCIVVPCKKELLMKANNASESSSDVVKIITDKNTILIDHVDIDKAYRNFKLVFSKTSINKLDKLLLNKTKSYLIPRLHQEYTVQKSLTLIENDEKFILWGHLPRSGKSYMMALLIYGYSIGRSEYNCLIITSVPNETIEQYIDIFNEHVEFENFNIIHLDDVKKISRLKKINIIIASKQFLQGKGAGKKKKGEVIKDLQKLDIYLRFVDETHFGGTSEISNNIYDLYGIEAPTIYMTATYFKPVSSFSIPKHSQIIWDLEDIKLCKDIDIEENQEILINKHGNYFGELITNYGINHIKDEYQKFPDLQILNLHLDCNKKEDYVKVMNKHNVGFSFNSLFMLKTKRKDKKDVAIEQFENENEMMKLCNKFFYKNNDIHSDFSFEVKENLLERIETFCIQNNSRTFSKEKPLSILIFLPHGDYNIPIEKVSNTFKKFLIKNKFMEDYEIITLSDTCNSKQLIHDANIKAINNQKKGVIILSGRKCSMGVTIPNCDIVMLMNDIHSADLIYQMMTRCLSEDTGKRFGFVVDLNLQRQISVIMEYALKCKDTLPPKETLRYLLTNRIINLKNDIFEFNENEMDTFVNKLYSIWSNEPKNTIRTLQRTIYIKTIDVFSNSEQNELNKIFFLGGGNNQTKTKVHESKDVDIHTGQERETNPDHSPSSSKKEEEKVEEKVNFIKDIIEHLVPFLCIITVRNEVYTFRDMYNVIKKDKVLLDITTSQFITWWGKNLPDNILDIVMEYYDKVNGKYNYDSITKRIKHIFLECKDDRKKFAETVVEYFTPTDREKKNNAEIPTPRELKLEMTSKVPEYFWLKLQKVLEPSVGKRGFCLELVEFFMKGLRKKIPDEEERYRKIVEDCLYFADINPVNIYITKLILDPNDEYKLNYYEGDALTLDCKRDFDIEGFDLVIGNPPYNSSGNTGTGNTIWQHFVKLSLEKWLLKNGYLCMVHPSGWRKPNTKKGKFYGLFELMTNENQMVYLEIHGLDDGKKVFGCGTRYDWYIIQKKPNNILSTVVDEKGVLSKIDMTQFKWLPSFNIDKCKNMLTEEKNNEELCPIIYDRSSYGADKKWTSKVKTSVFKYPCVHTTPKSGIRYMYSSRNDNGHFGVSKVIFGDSGINNPIIDLDGKYGMTQHSMAIKVDNKYEALNIKNAITSKKFNDLLESMLFSSYAIDWNIFKSFKRDFWTEFVEFDESLCPIIYDRSSYGADKKWMSKVKTDVFKYPCVHSTPKSGVRYMYSSKNDNGHFGVSKVIFGESGINHVVIDLNGEYGITHGAMGIKVSSEKEAKQIEKALLSVKFQDFLKSSLFSSFRIDWNIFKSFKRDFWKEFINEDSDEESDEETSSDEESDGESK